MSVVRSPPEALAKFPKYNLSVQLSEVPLLDGPVRVSKSQPSQVSSQESSFGEMPMIVVRSPPEALAKFPNCNLNVQLSEVPLFDGPV